MLTQTDLLTKKSEHIQQILSFNFDKRWRRFAVKVSNATPDAKILDVCTGTGDLAIEYSKVLNSSGKVIDADTLRLPFQDNCFQISAVAFGIRNVFDLKAGITEMARITAPGGRIVILEFSQPTNPLFKAIYYFYFKRILPFIGKIISRSKYDAYSYLPASVLNFPDRYGLKTILESCGLVNIEIYSRTLGIVTVHVGQKP